MPAPACSDIIASFLNRLEPGGRLALLVPIVFDAAAPMPWLSEAGYAGGDVFHVVDFTREPTDGAYREMVDEKANNTHAARPEPNRLPVRGFRITGWQLAVGASIPLSWPLIPETIADLLPDSARRTCQLYSLHDIHATGTLGAAAFLSKHWREFGNRKGPTTVILRQKMGDPATAKAVRTYNFSTALAA